MKNYVNLPFIMVPTEFVAWENESAGRTHCAAVFAHLVQLYTNRGALGVQVSDEFMQLTTTRILETMHYAMKNKKLTKCLQVLEDEGLVERQEKRNGMQTIKLCNEKVTELLEKYKNENNNRKFFVLYYVCFAYEQDRHPASNIGYMLSMFMQMLQAHSFATNMSDAYLQKCLGDVFSVKQVKNMLNILHNDCFATVDNRAKKIGESYVARRHIFMHEDALTELITKYHRDEITTSSYQGINLNSVIPTSQAQEQQKSLDGVKSEVPSDTEWDAIHKRWAELEAQGKRVEY